MKIEETKKTMDYDNVPFGGVFAYEGAIYVKTVPFDLSENECATTCNAIFLHNGEGDAFDGDASVIYYPNATLTLE